MFALAKRSHCSPVTLCSSIAAILALGAAVERQRSDMDIETRGINLREGERQKRFERNVQRRITKILDK